MKTYYFFDNDSGEEFFVEADSTPSAWRIAVENGFDENEIECLGTMTEEEAEMWGFDTYT